MDFLKKMKETMTSVLPVMLIVLVLGFTAAPLSPQTIIRFIIGGLLLIVGLTIFLLGVEIGIQPIGEMSGAALTSRRSLPLLLGVAFIIGFLVTVAEPDIQVFGDQIHSAFHAVNKLHLIGMIAAGVGLFLMLALMRTMLNFSIKITLLVCYVLIFALTCFAPKEFIGIAFDSGGATTGPMTVPFILALGVGVSSVRAARCKDGSCQEENSFGFTGVTSVGPVMAVLIYGILLKSGGALEAAAVQSGGAADGGGLGIFIRLLPSVLEESLLSIAPLAVLLAVFQLLLLKMPPRQVIRMAFGLLWSFIGLTLFLVGVNGGFMQAGREVGVILGTKAAELGGGWSFLLIATGLCMGAIVVCAEPAVWVLTEQVESLSRGAIKRKLMLVFLSIGSAVAIGLAMLRVLYGFSLMRILVPGYAFAMILMLFCPNLFTALAFDSGGVASGPITSTFVLAFTLGASHACSGNSDAFGVIALVAMTPLIAIQILGILYDFRKKAINRRMELLEQWR
ncbi:MAG: DUF1538 domain-containing protein [Treponemataceae bacterium]|nr:DUF1538 domain-containing protein [Treponemataceae bacterium]